MFGIRFSADCLSAHSCCSAALGASWLALPTPTTSCFRRAGICLTVSSGSGLFYSVFTALIVEGQAVPVDQLGSTAGPLPVRFTSDLRELAIRLRRQWIQAPRKCPRNRAHRFEPPPVRGDEESAMWEIKVGDRRAYNHELFGGFIVGEPRLRLASGAKSLPMPPETYPGAGLRRPWE